MINLGALTKLRIAFAIPCLILALFVAFHDDARAQETTGNLTGVVTDPTGAVVPDVNVQITEKATNRTITVRTDDAGRYYARQLNPGRYSVRFSLPGFTAREYNDVLVLVGKSFDLNAALSVGTVEETVQVTDSRPLIDFTDSTIAQNLTSEEIDRLPKGRSFQSLAIVAPFVNTGEVEGGIQVNGASGAENNFMVDGLSNTSLINGKSRQNAVFEFLQEVQIKTNGIDAEWGGALGGVINAITKSGGNEWHGEGHYYFYGSPISAGPVQRLVLNPADDKTVTYEQDYNNKNHNHEVGGSIGGPIIRNKLFWFGSLSPRFQRREIDYLFDNGAQPGSLSRKRLDLQAFNKLTFNPTDRIRTNWSWLYTPTYSTGGLPGFDSFGNTISSTLESNEAQRERGYNNHMTSYVGQIDIITSPASLLSFRGGYFYDNYKDVGVPNISAVSYRTSAIGLPFSVPSNLVGPVGFQNTPRIQPSFHDLVTRGYIQADYTHSFQGIGHHNLKGGAGTQKTVNNVDQAYPGGGYVYIWWDRAFRSNRTGKTDRGQYGYYEVNDIGTRGSTGAHITHLYLQDDWRIHPRINLTLGLRSERETIPSFARDVKPYAFRFNFGDKMSPRLGFSFDLTGDGRGKAYMFWNRLYDWTKYELSRGTFGGDFWRVHYRSLDTTDVFSLSGTNMPGRNLWDESAPNSFRNRRVPGFEDIDPDIKPMAQDNFGTGVEWQFTSSVVVAARYVHNNLLRTIEDVGSLVNGNEVYVYANPGEGLGSQYFSSNGVTPPGPNPRAKRVYDGMELSITKRFSSGWFGQASYVLSRLYGNYAGLANSDEISSPTTNRSSSTAQQQGGSIARPGSNVTRGWDLDELLFDANGNYVYGRLATDRPHVFKAYGGYNFAFGTEIGAFFYAGSGTPVSTLVQTINQIPIFVNGRGDLGRTPILSYTDLMVAHEFSLGERKRFRIEANAENLFNQKTARSIYSSLNRERRQSAAIDITHNPIDLTQGYDYNALLAATEEGANSLAPQFGKADIFNSGFSGRLGLKFIF